jgi:hypothetical protein
MAIAFDNASTGHATSASSLTFALTVGSGSNRKLWVGFNCNGVAIPAVSSVTYAGAAMTATPETPVAESGSLKLYLYYLDNPASGANNVVITMASATDEISAEAASYSGAAPGIDSHMSVTGTGTTAILTTTTVADNAWLVGHFRNDSAGHGTAGTATTRRAFVSGQCSFDDSGGAKSPAGSYSIRETFSSAAYGAIGASFAPYVAPPPSNGAFLLNFI